MEKRCFNLLVSIVCVLGLAVAPLLAAADLKQEFLDLQNKARAEEGAPPLQWDEEIAAYARNYANKRASDCQALYSGGPYGENIYWGYGDGYTDPTAAVTWWLKEKDNCNSGRDCSHYGQLVDPQATRVGCARVTCGDGNTFMICNYDPPAKN